MIWCKQFRARGRKWSITFTTSSGGAAVVGQECHGGIRTPFFELAIHSREIKEPGIYCSEIPEETETSG